MDKETLQKANALDDQIQSLQEHLDYIKQTRTGTELKVIKFSYQKNGWVHSSPRIEEIPEGLVEIFWSMYEAKIQTRIDCLTAELKSL